jgi:dTDP-4-amino-4,6-dideoxygalactose transaminase
MLAASAPATAGAVPFLDLDPVHAGLKTDLLAEIAELIDSGAFTNGPAVGEFEDAFAAYCGTARCVGVASGLDAIRLGLAAGGLERGDEVVVPANSFVATAEAVTQAGGAPVLVDVCETDYNLDVGAVETAIRPRDALPPAGAPGGEQRCPTGENRRRCAGAAAAGDQAASRLSKST